MKEKCHKCKKDASGGMVAIGEEVYHLDCAPKIILETKLFQTIKDIKAEVEALNSPTLYSEQKYFDGEKYYGISGKNWVSKKQVLAILERIGK